MIEMPPQNDPPIPYNFTPEQVYGEYVFYAAKETAQETSERIYKKRTMDSAQAALDAIRLGEGEGEEETKKKPEDEAEALDEFLLGDEARTPGVSEKEEKGKGMDALVVEESKEEWNDKEAEEEKLKAEKLEEEQKGEKPEEAKPEEDRKEDDASTIHSTSKSFHTPLPNSPFPPFPTQIGLNKPQFTQPPNLPIFKHLYQEAMRKEMKKGEGSRFGVHPALREEEEEESDDEFHTQNRLLPQDESDDETHTQNILPDSFRLAEKLEECDSLFEDEDEDESDDEPPLILEDEFKELISLREKNYEKGNWI